MLTWLADDLRAAGLRVREMDDWLHRGRDLRQVHGVVWHHTATGPNVSDARVAGLLRDGRPDLRGPLSQLGLARDGSFDVIAAGRCHHNGYGEWGNDSVGIEAYNDGVGEPWPAAQLDAYERGTAVILRRLGLGVDRVKGHKETDPRRKIDPAGIDMHQARANVARLLTAPAPSEEDDDMRYVRETDTGNIYALYGQRFRHLSRKAWDGQQSVAALSGKPIEVTPMHSWAFAHLVLTLGLLRDKG